MNQIDESEKIPADGFRQCDPRILSQQLRQPEDIIAVFPDIPSIDVRGRLGPSDEVDNRAGLERYEQGLVDDRNAVNLVPGALECLETGVVQQDRR